MAQRPHDTQAEPFTIASVVVTEWVASGPGANKRHVPIGLDNAWDRVSGPTDSCCSWVRSRRVLHRVGAVAALRPADLRCSRPEPGSWDCWRDEPRSFTPSGG
jgi:hypothetical protein